MKQCLEALESANESRLARSTLCASLRRREILFADLDLSDPCLRTLQVLKLLQSIPWRRGAVVGGRRYATTRPLRTMREAGVPSTFTVGQLTERQQTALKALVARDCPSQNVSPGVKSIHKDSLNSASRGTDLEGAVA